MTTNTATFKYSTLDQETRSNLSPVELDVLRLQEESQTLIDEIEQSKINYQYQIELSEALSLYIKATQELSEEEFDHWCKENARITSISQKAIFEALLSEEA